MQIFNIKVVVAPKSRSLEKKISYDFKAWNDIINRVIYVQKTLFFIKKKLKLTKNTTKKSFFDLKKLLDCFFFFELMK